MTSIVQRNWCNLRRTTPADAAAPRARWHYHGAAVLCAATLAVGCSGTVFDRGQELSHTYRGAPVEPAAPGMASVSGGSAARGNGPQVSISGVAGADAPPALQPAPRRPGAPEALFQAMPAPMIEAKPVNVFGEMDGVPRPPSKVTGDAGYQQHSFTDEGADSDVAVDPTGKWIVFASTRHSDHTDLYMQRVDGTAVTELTSDAADDAYPCFSPDGKQIAFASTRAGPWQIFVMDADGRNVIQVTSGTMQCVHPSFSPDGTRVVYSAIGSRSNQWELWTSDLRTNEKKMIGYGLFPRWSPDKTVDRIAYQKSRQRGGRWFSLWTLDLVEGEGRRMTEVVASTNAAIVSPSWSPEGRRIAFTTVMEPARAAPGGRPVQQGSRLRPQQDIWTINADGSNRQRLSDGNGTNLSPFWASDNRIYFISDRGGNECVWSVRADAAKGSAVASTPAPAKPQPSSANAAAE